MDSYIFDAVARDMCAGRGKTKGHRVTEKKLKGRPYCMKCLIDMGNIAQVLDMWAIVISRGSLPDVVEVDENRAVSHAGDVSVYAQDSSPRELQDIARSYLALAEWVNWHPEPSDEKINRLSEILGEFWEGDLRDISRKLLRNGVSVQ